MNNEIAQLFQLQIGYTFKNQDLLEQAFVRRSYSKEHGGGDNEVLEFIGDKALDLVIVKLLTEKYGSFAEDYNDYESGEPNDFISDFSEGKLTEMKKKLVCRKMLASRIRRLGFHHELIMGKGDWEQHIEEQESVQEDLFEAIIGAVAIDSNWNLDVLTEVVDLLLEPSFYLDNGFDDQENFVDLLQQWYQKKHHMIPVYVFRKTNGFSYYGKHGKYMCELGLSPLNDGFWDTGDTKSEARMKVAQQAYQYLEENNLLFSLIDEVGEPNIDKAINQLQELYQKGYINEPWYEFEEMHDEDGNPIWQCECCLNEKNYSGYFFSKKYGKKAVAYKMLCDILDWEDDEDDES